MKKLLIVTAVLLLMITAGWLGSSWFIGIQTEKIVRDKLEIPDIESGDTIATHSLVSYQRSLFKAQAVTRHNVRQTPLEAWVNEITLVHDIQHGPLWWSNEKPVPGLSFWRSQLDTDVLEQDLGAELLDVFERSVPLLVKTTVDFQQQIKVDGQLSGFQLQNAADEFVTSAGMTLLGHIDAKGGSSAPWHLQGTGLALINSELTLSFPEFTMISAAAFTNKVGNNDFEITAKQASLQLSEAITPINFDLKAVSDYQFRDDELQGKLKMDLEAISGVSYPLRSVRTVLDYAGINQQGLQRINLLQNRLQDLQAQLLWNEEEIELPETRRKIFQLEQEMQTVAQRLLTTFFEEALQENRSRLNMRFDLQTADGAIRHQADVSYAGLGETITLDKLMQFGPEDWGRMLRGRVTLDAAESAIPGELGLILYYPVDQGALVKDDGHYQMELILDGEQVELNGTVLALTDLPGKFIPGIPPFKESAEVEIPAEVLAMIESKGLTSEVMQELEQSDDVSADTLQLLRQFQEMSEQLQ